MQAYKLLFMMVATGWAVSAVAELNVVSVQAGVFERPALKEESDRILIRGSQEHIRPTKKVVAALGTKFGIRYQVDGKSQANNLVTLLYLTPGIIDAQGVRHDKYTEVKDLRASAGSHTMAFEMVEPYELVPGTWQMMVFEKDRLLVRETFEVIIKGTEVLSGFDQTVIQ